MEDNQRNITSFPLLGEEKSEEFGSTSVNMTSDAVVLPHGTMEMTCLDNCLNNKDWTKAMKVPIIIPKDGKPVPLRFRCRMMVKVSGPEPNQGVVDVPAPVSETKPGNKKTVAEECFLLRRDAEAQAVENACVKPTKAPVLKSILKTEKNKKCNTVHFTESLPTIHSIPDSPEIRAVRNGHCWIEMAADRDRFQRRVKQAEEIISPCLTAEHRARILKAQTAQEEPTSLVSVPLAPPQSKQSDIVEPSVPQRITPTQDATPTIAADLKSKSKQKTKKSKKCKTASVAPQNTPTQEAKPTTAPVSTLKSILKNKKCKTVLFDENLTTIHSIPDSPEIRAARNGHCWIEMAADRDRFRRRVQQMEEVISPCLTAEHRAQILKARAEQQPGSVKTEEPDQQTTTPPQTTPTQEAKPATAPVSTLKSILKTEKNKKCKTVRFAENLTTIHTIPDSPEIRAARIGRCWMEMAAKRNRFQRRRQQMGEVIRVLLRLRNRINKHYSSTNHTHSEGEADHSHRRVQQTGEVISPCLTAEHRTQILKSRAAQQPGSVKTEEPDQQTTTPPQNTPTQEAKLTTATDSKSKQKKKKTKKCKSVRATEHAVKTEEPDQEPTTLVPPQCKKSDVVEPSVAPQNTPTQEAKPTTAPVSTLKSILKTEKNKKCKTVRFAENLTTIHTIPDSPEIRAARIGRCWMEMAAKRNRFQRRRQQMGEVIRVLLRLRNRISKHYSSTNHTHSGGEADHSH